MALLLAEGQTEDALQPGSKALELDPSARTYMALARAHLAATCALACQARAEEQKTKAGLGPEPARGKDAGTLQAGAMWRVMEAGRNYEAAANAEPENEAAQEASLKSKPLRNLDAFRVSRTAELFELAECSVYEGKRLNGKRCPRNTEDGMPEPTKGSKKKKKKKEDTPELAKPRKPMPWE